MCSGPNLQISPEAALTHSRFSLHLGQAFADLGLATAAGLGLLQVAACSFGPAAGVGRLPGGGANKFQLLWVTLKTTLVVASWSDEKTTLESRRRFA